MVVGLVYFLFSLLFLASVALSTANFVNDVEYWQNRAIEAHSRILKAYVPEPTTVINHFNELGRNSSSRRSLRGHQRIAGPCKATNPIDKCWRCRADWASDRKRIARCAKGFGRNTLGGVRGNYYVVTDTSDDNLLDPRPGTLRYGVTRDVPLWIIFGHDMIIKLQQELMINSYKTIDARGANVHIAYGAGLTIQFVQHVIIHNLHIHDIKPASGGNVRDSEHHWGFRTQSDGDGISIFGATNVWVDHLTMHNCADGLIDAINASTAITISNCHFSHHDHVILLGASDKNEDDVKMQVTIAYNHFGRGLTQRMPRCRWGFFHVVNNDYSQWLMYAIGGSQNATVISQGNRYVGPPVIFAKEVTKRVNVASDSDWRDWTWRSEGDLFLRGAFFVESGLQFTRNNSRFDFIKARPGSFVSRLTRFSRTLICKPNHPC